MNFTDFITDKNFLRLSGKLLNTNYYRWVLTSNDKIVLQTLWKSFLVNGADPYLKGLLIVNIKQKSLMEKIGNITQSTCMRSLKKLNKLGVIIKVKNDARNNKYLVGFRSEGNENLYLFYYLVNKYNELVKKEIEKQQSVIEKQWNVPKIKDINPYCLDSVIRDFIMMSINSSKLFTEEIENGRTLLEILFNRNDYYKFKISELLSHSGHSVAIMAPK
jgi:DNA-binding HxlR family transcriptional regulator